jgi:uncharacterized membrane protein
MVVMLLDHARDFFHFGNITANLNPLNPVESSVPVYLTRWITHLCAPTFVALAGISIFLQLEKSKSKPGFSLSTFLLDYAFMRSHFCCPGRNFYFSAIGKK